MWLHGRACPILGYGLKLPEVGQANDGRAPLLGDTDVRPKLYVYLGSLLNQQVLHGSAVAILHLFDASVVRHFAAHLEVLAR